MGMSKIELKGRDRIIIDRTENDLRFIHAKSDHDVSYGIGYCHAMDRGMQMIMMKVLGSGTASEHLSGDDDMLEIDKFFRKMNWYSELKSEIKKLSPEEQSLLQAYCDGANAAFAKSKPWELKWLLGYKAFSWTLEDIVLLVRMTGFLTLAQSQGEIERLFVQMVQHGVSRKLLNELFPNILGDYDEDLLKKISLQEKLVPDAIKWNVGLSPSMASNNWAVSGSRTKSGLPIMANDPHLEINRLPAVWYEVVINSHNGSSAGATMPGIPSLVIGRKEGLSWGATYTFMDAIDSWIEQCKDGKYLKDGAWHSFQTRTETIKRKKGKPVVVTYYENEHGVLEGDPKIDGYYLCTKWSSHRSGARSIRSGIEMWNASDVEEGMKLLGELEVSFNWVLADDKGNIGYQMSGLLPKRKREESGFTPLIGWNSEYDWQGYIPVGDLPRSLNPDEGYIVTANNDLNHLGIANPINIPMGSYRADRIKNILDAGDAHTVQDMKKMHYDTFSLQAELFMQIIRPLLPDSENGQILKDWDLCYDVESKGAYLFEMIYRRLYYDVFGDVLGKDLVDFLQNETGVFIDFYDNFDKILLSKDSAWFKGRSRQELFSNAIIATMGSTAKAWGSVNQITLSNMVLGGKLPKFLGFDAGPYPLCGGRSTIHQGQVYQSAGRQTSFAPSFRIITDMSGSIVHTNLAGGVSDRRFSGLYNNDFENWMSGIYKKTDLNKGKS
ncbi:MAG: penicillin acylase family protein [Bacteroidetes bacterium]|nr:penicillin acylase family protein [Bacteroidota bacterium]